VELGDEVQRRELKRTLETRKLFRRGINVLKREAPVSLSHLETCQAIAAELPNFSVAHVARFLATGRISNIVSAQRRVFHEELARLLSESGWIALSRMLVGDRAIAWNYGFRFQGSWFWYQPTFDTQYEQISPGACILTKLITEACDDPEMRVVDLGLGAEGYKERFANQVRSTQQAILTTSAGQHLRESARYRAARTVKVIPGAEPVVRSMRAHLGRVWQRLRQGGVESLRTRGMRRLGRLFRSHNEVLFYQWAQGRGGQTGEGGRGAFQLQPLTLEDLAKTAMAYELDTETLDYALRSARRLRQHTAQGFALVDAQRIPLHVCWATDFEGFEMAELRVRLSAENPVAALIFDCWTPVPARGHGFYPTALALLARHLSEEGREPWIFSAVTNLPSIHGIEKAGFAPRYAMIRKTTLAWQNVSRVAFAGSSPTEEAQVNA
jgi:hypothetical protein